jgi:hypothetical protein
MGTLNQYEGLTYTPWCLSRFSPVHTLVWLCFAIAFSLFLPLAAFGATLKLTPETGVYSIGGTITARVVVNSQGKPINAAEGSLSYNTKELQVLGISKTGSIFSLWTIEPAFGSGKISFGGGSPAGYTGGAGTVMSITFKVLTAGTPKVNFTQGSVLAADGLGTNVLSGMSGATYTVGGSTPAPTPTTPVAPPSGATPSVPTTEVPNVTPEPEYVTRRNTPNAPKVTSSTHADPERWYKETTATLAWEIPSGVTAVRTALDSRSSTVPTVLYEPPIKEKELTALEDIGYFHIQFKNAEGWGAITHFRIAVDTEAPTAFTIAEALHATNTARNFLKLEATDALSGIERFEISIDGIPKEVWRDVKKDGLYELPLLKSGTYTITGEAFDFAGNSRSASHTLTIETIPTPTITEYATEQTESSIPVIKGTALPNSRVLIAIVPKGSSGDITASEREVRAGSDGTFTFVADGRLTPGAYEITARAILDDGRQSVRSEAYSFAVHASAIRRVGASLITFLSVVIPLIGLSFLLAALLYIGTHRTRSLIARLRKETKEADDTFAREMGALIDDIRAEISDLRARKQDKLTKAEAALLHSIEGRITNAASRVEKEINDISRLLK